MSIYRISLSIRQLLSSINKLPIEHKIALGGLLVGLFTLIFDTAFNSINLFNPSSPSSSTQISENLIKYEDTEYGITLKYPPNWKKKERADIWGKQVIFVPQPKNDSDTSTENVSVTIEVEVLQQLQTLDEYTELYVKDTIKPQEVEDFQKNKYELSTSDAYKIIFTKADEPSKSTKNMRILTIQNNKAYIISYTAETSKYSNYLPTAKKIIDSFNE